MNSIYLSSEGKKKRPGTAYALNGTGKNGNSINPVDTFDDNEPWLILDGNAAMGGKDLMPVTSGDYNPEAKDGL